MKVNKNMFEYVLHKNKNMFPVQSFSLTCNMLTSRWILQCVSIFEK